MLSKGPTETTEKAKTAQSLEALDQLTCWLCPMAGQYDLILVINNSKIDIVSILIRDFFHINT